MPIIAPVAESSPLGTVYLAPTPDNFVLFYTGSEFDGRLANGVSDVVRQFLHDRFQLDASLTTCHQVHGTAVKTFRGDATGWCEESACDALWSNARGSAIGIKIADCLPVTLIDPGASAFANIHAGWRGASSDIIGAALSEVEQHSMFAPSRAHAYLGPSIRSCCFEVGEEVVDAFTARYGDSVQAAVDRTRGERPYLDLVAIATDVLVRRGFSLGSVIDSGICTRCDERFHSYRRNGANAGRNLAIAAH